MNKKKKVLVFSPPFNGHLAILKELILDQKDNFDFHIVINSWKNIKQDISDLDPSKISILQTEDLNDTDPTQWTFPRVVNQIEQCIEITKIISPDLIIYDFFSLEGYFVAKLFNIPFWCSIPALIGSFNNVDYRDLKLSTEVNKTAIQVLNEKYQLTLANDEVEMISDGFFIHGEKNIVWSFPALVPSNFKQNRSKAEYFFVGNLRGDNYKHVTSSNKTPKIYFSLGTVVMDNNWNQQEDLRNGLKTLVNKLALIWENKNLSVTFVTQGKQVLENCPPNWSVVAYANQVKELSNSDIFITHGGSNSFHEAVMQKVPMIVLPFFGDQPLIANQIKKLGIGINLIDDENIDTKKDKSFLNENLAIKIDKSVTEILSNEKFKTNLNNLYLDHTPIKELLDKC